MDRRTRTRQQQQRGSQRAGSGCFRGPPARGQAKAGPHLRMTGFRSTEKTETRKRTMPARVSRITVLPRSLMRNCVVEREPGGGRGRGEEGSHVWCSRCRREGGHAASWLLARTVGGLGWPAVCGAPQLGCPRPADAGGTAVTGNGG